MQNNTVNIADHTAAKERRARREKFLDHYIKMRGYTLIFPLRYDRMMGLLSSSFEEKDAYVRAEQRRFFKVMGVIALLWIGWSIYRHYVPAPIPPAPPPPIFEAAGTVQDIQLHSTTFSTETTVKTTTGVFQVHGGVSAAIGDPAQIKRDASGIIKAALCIQSAVKTDCYSIL